METGTEKPAAKTVKKPIGRELSFAAKALDRAFNAALVEAGGSLPMWLVLLSAKREGCLKQHDLARAVGIESPTLTRHLDGLESSGLVSRSRDPDDRRVMRVELTDAGEEVFERLRQAAMAFDRKLRSGVGEEELDAFRATLHRLVGNISS